MAQLVTLSHLTKKKVIHYLTNPTNDDFEDYDNEEGENLADKMVATGHDFSWEDYNMHKDGGKKSSKYNYDAYGGYDNWYNNHSMYGSKGFTGSKNVMSGSEVAAAETKRAQATKDYKTSDAYMNKYGQYDWAQNQFQNNTVGF